MLRALPLGVWLSLESVGPWGWMICDMGVWLSLDRASAS